MNKNELFEMTPVRILYEASKISMLHQGEEIKIKDQGISELDEYIVLYFRPEHYKNAFVKKEEK